MIVLNLEAMKMFTEGIIEVFGGHYLRRPTLEDAECLLKIGESMLIFIKRRV